MALTDRDKRTLRIGGIIVGVLLVGFLVFKLLGGGGGEVATRSTPPRTTSAPGGGQPTETPSLTPSPVLVLPVRDPFSIPPGFPVTATSTSGSSGTGTSSSGTTTSTGTGTSTSTGTGTGTRTPTQSGNSGGTTIGGHQVQLIDVLTQNGAEQATVSVDGTVYHPSAGDSFGPSHQYMLQSVSGNCATFLFGDQAFTLCVPQNK